MTQGMSGQPECDTVGLHPGDLDAAQKDSLFFMYSFIYYFIKVQLVYQKTAHNYCIKFSDSRHMYTLMLPSPQSRK